MICSLFVHKNLNISCFIIQPVPTGDTAISKAWIIRMRIIFWPDEAW